MKKGKWFQFIVVLAVLPAFFNSGGHVMAQEYKTGMSDSIEYVVFADSLYFPLFFRNATPSDISSDEISEAFGLLKKSVADYNEKLLKSATYPDRIRLIDLKRYKVQLFAAIVNGEKQVYLNCFCDDSKNWKTNMVMVDDGGDCYFQVKVNLHTKKFFEFMVNGIG